MATFGGSDDDETVRFRDKRDPDTDNMVSLLAVVEAAKAYRHALQNTKIEWTLAKLGDGSDQAAVKDSVRALVTAQNRLFAALDELAPPRRPE
jgi:hypothetical protein